MPVRALPDPRGLVAPGDSARTPPPSSTPTLPVLCSWFYCMPGCYSTACIVLPLMYCFFLYSYLFSEFPVSLELPLYKLLKVSVIHVQVNVLMLFIFIVISGIPLFIQVPTLTFPVLNTFIVKQCIAVNKYLFDTSVPVHLSKQFTSK